MKNSKKSPEAAVINSDITAKLASQQVVDPAKKSAKEKLAERKAKKEAAKADLKDANEAQIIQEVIVHKDLKWLYPDGMVDTLLRKTFRQKQRAKIRSMERALAKIQDEVAKATAQETLLTFRKSVLANPTIEV